MGWPLPTGCDFLEEHEVTQRVRPGITRPAYWPLLPVLLAYCFVASLYAVYTPPWQAPDEPAHYNYVRQLAGGRLPVIEPADYDEAYRAEIVSSGFPAGYSIEPLTYEDWQPPLYYLLQTPIFWLFDGSLLALRLFSVAVGAGVVLLAHAAAAQVWPDRRWLALTAAVFVAFLPQHVAMLASVNNDSLAELLIAALLVLLLAARPGGQEDGGVAQNGRRLWPVTGLLLGLGFLTKATVYLMAPVAALALLVRYRGAWRSLAAAGVRLFGPALLLGAPWWLRNRLVYGGLDVMGAAAHNTAVSGQLRTAEWLAQVGPMAAVHSFAQTTFRSFWGQFGWMGVVMDPRIYQALLLFSLVALAGLIWFTWRRTKGKGRRPLAYPATVLGSTLALSLLLYLGYNVTFVQHQGRYLFPALIPIAMAVSAGLMAWARPVVARHPEMGWLLPAGLGLALVALDLVALFYFIVPQLS